MASDRTRDSNTVTQHYLLEVIDRDGWRNEFPLQKNVVHIGSSSRSDIVLEPARGEHVAPLHAQLILPISKEGQSARVGRCQLVNLGDEDIQLGTSGDRNLSPRSAMQLESGMAFRLGQFTLVLHGNGEVSDDLTLSSQHIGLSLSLSRTQLEPNRCLEGVVKVSNQGQRSGVQIELDLEGMDPDCYDLEPGPILSSGAEKEVFFRLRHHGHKPLAGNCHITFRATAPHSYPGDEAQISQLIEVLPFFQHKMRLLSADGTSPSWLEKTQQSDLDPTISGERRAERHQGMSSAAGTSASPRGTAQPSDPKAEGETSPPQPAKWESEEPRPSPSKVRGAYVTGAESRPTRENRWSRLLTNLFSRPRPDSPKPMPSQQPTAAHSEATPLPTIEVQRPADESQTLEEVDVQPPPEDDHATLEQALHAPSSDLAQVEPSAGEPDSGEPVAAEPGSILSTPSEKQAAEEEPAATQKSEPTPEAGLSTPPLTGRPTPAPEDVPLADDEIGGDAEAVPDTALSSGRQDPSPADSPPDLETTQRESSQSEPVPDASDQRQEPSEEPPGLQSSTAHPQRQPVPRAGRQADQGAPTPQDWWLPAEDQGDDEISVLRLKAHPPDTAKTTKARHNDSPLTQDWWTPEAASDQQGVEPDREAPVLKLKATPPADADTTAIPKGSSTPADEWWSEAGDAEAEPPETERPVLRLKIDSSETESETESD
jgi:hypothetical protein